MKNVIEWQLNKNVPGVKPAVQQRSRHRRNQLIDTGIKLLCKKSISQISIADLCKDCGFSVGTFYSRFDDKLSFFRAVQEASVTEMLRRLEYVITDVSKAPTVPEDVFRKVVNATMDIVTSEIRGVLRESLVNSPKDSLGWEPIRVCGKKMTEVLLDTLKADFCDQSPEESKNSIFFGMQMLFGTLVQAILNDPGPIKLDDPQMRENLTRMLTVYSKLKPINS